MGSQDPLCSQLYNQNSSKFHIIPAYNKACPNLCQSCCFPAFNGFAWFCLHRSVKSREANPYILYVSNSPNRQQLSHCLVRLWRPKFATQATAGASLPFGGRCRNLELSIANQGLHQAGSSSYVSDILSRQQGVLC